MWDFSRELARFGPEGSDNRLSLPSARAYCTHVCRSHYENFAVASLFLPRRLLKHFHAVYAYCRWSDDLADETPVGQSALELLQWWRGELATVYRGSPRHPVMIALQPTVQRFQIPEQLLLDLLTAFTQDQTVQRYSTFDELLGYCRNSANPVGRLVLHLFELADEERCRFSDEICTGLQLANFWQDVARDWKIGRVYIPREDLERFHVSETVIASGTSTSEFRELLRFEVQRTRGYFQRGRALLPLLKGGLRREIELVVLGGEAILTAIEAAEFKVLERRPEVGKLQKLRLLGQVLVSALGS